MIDTDKYEGHTPHGWYVDDAPDVIHPTVIHSNEYDTIVAELVMVDGEEWTEEDYANARLIAAAPLLLEEVKRLRNAFAYAATMAQCSIEDDDFSFHEIRDYCLETCDISIHDAEVMTNNELFGGEEE